MHDLKWIESHEELARKKLELRDAAGALDGLFALNASRKERIKAYDELRHEQRRLSEIFKAKGADPAEVQSAREHLKTVSDELKRLDAERTEIEEKIQEALLFAPNFPHDSVPEGHSEADNVEVRTWGERRAFSFAPREHVEIGEALGILDFDAAAALSGARFALYRGAGALFERALMMFMLDLHTREHGYTEILPPVLVSPHCMLGTGQLPKFASDAFQTDSGHYLIPTAEVPVTNLHRDQILDGSLLPIRYAAYSSCFRKEAGSYGRDTRGLTRLHQFQKVELVKFAAPETSFAELETLTGNAERVLQLLGLPYRVMLLCTGDLGFTSAKTYDLEVWLPGQNMWREISSCSNFEAFQARRANIRFRREPQAKPELVHTLNGSGLAIGRTVMAILENYQEADGSVTVPEALRPYMGGLERVTKP
jgi:seryl-tRNA synthetase